MATSSGKLLKLPSFLAPEFEEQEDEESNIENMDTTKPSEIQCSPDRYIKSNKLHSAAEHALFIAWKESDEKRKQLEKSNVELQRRIEDLELRFQKIEQNIQQPCSPAVAENYSTNEDELEKETEWIRARNKRTTKKRKLNSTLSPEPKNEPTGNHRQLNKITSLQKNKGEEVKNKKKETPPPPIIVDGIKSLESLHKSLKKVTSDEKFRIKLLSRETFKVNSVDSETYRNITKELINDGFNWHSYENKQVRPIRVMIKKLHHSCSIESIMEDLKAKGLLVVDVVNKLKWKTKEPLDMFMVSFSAEENVKKVFELKHILGCRVEVEALKKVNLIPQCKRCQAFNHTQAYCNKEARCVKCAGKHASKECTKPSEALPKCIHCGEAHPASYRGCSVAIELQKIRNSSRVASKNITSKNVVDSQARNVANSQSRPTQHQSRPTEKRMTFAEIVSKENKSQMKKNEEVKDTSQILQLILSKLDKQEKLISSLQSRIEKLDNNRQQKPK
jgi:hypothetical protein